MGHGVGEVLAIAVSALSEEDGGSCMEAVGRPVDDAVDAVRAIGDTADFKFRILHRLDSDPTAAILYAARRENLDVYLVSKNLRRNRVLFVAVNPATLSFKLIAPVETVKAPRRMD